MVLDRIECGRFTVDKFFDVRYGSEKYFEYIGKEAYRALPKLLYSDDAERFCTFFETVGEKWRGITVRLKRADDVYRDAYIRVRKKLKLVGGEQLWDVEMYDIASLIGAYGHVNGDIEKYRTLLGMVNRTYFCYDHAEGVLEMYRVSNGRERKFFSMQPDDCKSALEGGHIDAADEDIFMKLCEDIVRGVPEISAELSTDLYSAEAEIKPCRITGSTITKEGEPIVTVGIVEKLAKEMNALPAENREAVIDPLTRLYNKKYIQSKVKEAIENKKDEHVAVFIMDIDNFKEINDNFGHMFGDEILSRVAGVVLDVLADNGIAGRIGGDEFMGIIYNVKDKEMIRHILRSIRSSVEYLYSDINGLSVTCSIGAVRYPENFLTYDEIFNCADKCLYIAKEKGKNRYVIYQEELHGSIRNVRRGQTEIDHISGVVAEDSSYVVKKAIELVFEKGSAAIPEILKSMAEAGRFDRACVYYEPGMNLVYSYGSECSITAFWDGSAPYLEHFGSSGLHVANNLFKVEGTDKGIYEKFCRQHTGCFVQAILGDKDNICGYTSFECCSGGKRFSDTLLNSIDYISKLIYEVLSREDRTRI